MISGDNVPSKFDALHKVSKSGRCISRTHFADKLSEPIARPHSISPFLIWLEMIEMAMRPLEQKRLTDWTQDVSAVHAISMFSKKDEKTYGNQQSKRLLVHLGCC